MIQSAAKSVRLQILATVEKEDFIGRNTELDTLIRCAADHNYTHGILLSSAPALGISELLRQTYDRLFLGQQNTIPFYFQLKKSDKTAKQAALRFLQTFLLQSVAFRRQNADILRISPDTCELSELALASDLTWIKPLIENCGEESRVNDERTFIVNCLSAPLRAFADSVRSFVMIDDLHEADRLDGGVLLTEILEDIFTGSEIPFAIAGKRRFLFNRIRLANAEKIELKPLPFYEAGLVAESLARNYSVNITEQTRDLIAAQSYGNPLVIKLLIGGAQKNKIDPDTFQKTQKVYAAELFRGGIRKYFDNIFNDAVPDLETQKNILGLLYDALTIDREKTPTETWQRRTGLKDDEFYQTINLLNRNEIVRVSSNLIEPMIENRILSDYVKSRFRLEMIAEPRALVVGEMLSEFIKRAPKTMAKCYRRRSAVGLRELLTVFDFQEIPEFLLNYDTFKEQFKGLSDEEILTNTGGENKKIRLPQISYAAHSAAFYPPIEQVTEKERSAVGFGFREGSYSDEDEIVWISAELDSKLEASKELTEFWCDRLEMVALMCNFTKYKIWLVAPEGFSPEAIEVLRLRNAYGSSRRQIELLIKFLGAEEKVGQKLTANEYEMVVPMGDETELIAAHAVEEIARRHHFEPKAINQIKTALVEACINAAEHSHSPDRKIYQKFTVEDDKITIIISNRGLRLTDKKAREIKPDEGRRGWGLKLIQNLMDEVKFEQVDDGTRISMTKYLKK